VSLPASEFVVLKSIIINQSCKTSNNINSTKETENIIYNRSTKVSLHIFYSMAAVSDYHIDANFDFNNLDVC
jgi:hypothetical protein